VPPFEKTINTARTCRQHDKRAIVKITGTDIAADAAVEIAIANSIAAAVG
jgi:hypothetical protein